MRSCEEALCLLREHQVLSPQLVHFESDNGTCLVLGMGSRTVPLVFWHPSGESFHSVGPEAGLGMGEFRGLSGEHSGVPVDTNVSLKVALEAACEYIQTGGNMPGCIAWESDFG